MKLSTVLLNDLVISWTLVANLFMNSWLCLADECVRIDDCSCETSQYKIDLNSLRSYLTSETPYFKDVKGTKDQALYSYQPCLPFSESTCKNVAVCRTSAGTSESWAPTSKFGGDPATDTLYVNYTSPNNKITQVKLSCASEDIEKNALTVTGESSPNSTLYLMELNTSLVCVKKGLSNGSILIIVFFVLVLVYVLGGMLFLYFFRGARGVEMIPNYEFWSEFPLLVKDGIAFTMRGCKTEATYEQI